ncbi:Type I restriction modification DNA specificity domain protein [Pseudodesulfovibrio hydrargyri]|uniref:Type I restriction modification DNA specificity domain protein n=1 Tax=Pseudodesulfovibrio hydrargyri TaxID=2125990 RepID=A0A1J5MX74_9BACT|nr:restriction endonuclease subunit S [Pseudodesulfovibrio hydrargyri]OIQ50554.1 Type I restriction modification DNA specificity domain protein [Pseudodesulfovibrio hydrargyri]
MAISNTVCVSSLDSTYILSPERYDPRRSVNLYSKVTLGDICSLRKESFNPKKASSDDMCLVLDTNDASEGVIFTRKTCVSGPEVGSSKKIIHAGDIIISRLRPYLRQVAYVDDALFHLHEGNYRIICSTEFYVLAPKESSIGFLVPYLLSSVIQDSLQASTEGGHHPRFSVDTLLKLPIPEDLLAMSNNLSDSTLRHVNMFREGEQGLFKLIPDFS